MTLKSWLSSRSSRPWAACSSWGSSQKLHSWTTSSQRIRIQYHITFWTSCCHFCCIQIPGSERKLSISSWSLAIMRIPSCWPKRRSSVLSEGNSSLISRIQSLPIYSCSAQAHPETCFLNCVLPSPGIPSSRWWRQTTRSSSTSSSSSYQRQTSTLSTNWARSLLKPKDSISKTVRWEQITRATPAGPMGAFPGEVSTIISTESSKSQHCWLSRRSLTRKELKEAAIRSARTGLWNEILPTTTTSTLSHASR